MDEDVDKNVKALIREMARKARMEQSRGEFEKWNELPPEMKMENASSSDFEDREGSRRYARRSSGRRDPVSRGYRSSEGFKIFGLYGLPKKFRFDIDFSEKVESLFEQVIKKSEIRVINLHKFVLPDLENLNVEPRSLKIQELYIEGTQKEQTETSLWFLEKAWTKIQNLRVARVHDETFFEKFFENPARWSTNNDLEIGSKIRTALQEDYGYAGYPFDYEIGPQDIFTLLCEQLSDRKISMTDSMLRLSTSNQTKHIIIHFDYRRIPQHPYINGIVIPSSLPDDQIHECLQYHPID
uniref:FTH domain-containing protein n=1 Tax=Caenorhabditis tropicalis TaxID=1561998 RepID=A0A1I7TS51_9PELO